MIYHPFCDAKALWFKVCLYLRFGWSNTVALYYSAVDTRPQRSIETIASFDQWSGTIKTIESNGNKIKNH